MDEFINIVNSDINNIDLSEFNNIKLNNNEKKTKGTENEYELIFKKLFLYNKLKELDKTELPI
jgi:hypothetical protein